MACGLDPRNAEPAPEVRLYHITDRTAREAVVRRPNGRQCCNTQPRCLLRQRKYALIFAEPHRLELEE